MDGCRLDLPPRRLCLPFTWSSVSRCLSAVHRRRPLRHLWVRDATSFRLGLIGILLAALLILIPGYDLFFVELPKRSWLVALWLVCAMAGAVFAAFAFGRQRASAARRGLPSFMVAILLASPSWQPAPSWTPLGRLPSSETGFSVQALLTLLYGVLHAGGGGFSWCSRFTPFIDLRAMGRRVVRLGFRRFFSPLYGVFGTYLHFPLPAHRHLRRRSRADHNSHLSRSASFLLLARQRYVSFVSRGTCSD